MEAASFFSAGMEALRRQGDLGSPCRRTAAHPAGKKDTADSPGSLFAKGAPPKT